MKLTALNQTGFNGTKIGLKMNKRHFLILFLISLLFGFYGRIEQAATATEGQAIWAELLNKYVKPGGVDYAGFKSEEKKYVHITKSSTAHLNQQMRRLNPITKNW